MNQFISKINRGLILLMVIYLIPVKGFSQSNPESILLKDYRPISIYKVPQSNIQKAKFPSSPIEEPFAHMLRRVFRRSDTPDPQNDHKNRSYRKWNDKPRLAHHRQN